METLQLVAHLRDVREGKGERERSWDAYIWLAQKHPRTLLVNLPEVVKVLLATTFCHVMLGTDTSIFRCTEWESYCIAILAAAAPDSCTTAVHYAVQASGSGIQVSLAEPCVLRVQVGFWKDLLQLLLRLCLGEHGWKAAAEQEAGRKMSSRGSRTLRGNRKERRVAKLKRLREWRASLKTAARAADPAKASADSDQPRAGDIGGEAAAQHKKAVNRRLRQMGKFARRRCGRRDYRAIMRRVAQDTGQGISSADSVQPLRRHVEGL